MQDDYGDPQHDSPQREDPQVLTVYVMHAQGTCLIKIGHTQEIDQRIVYLQPGCPYPLRVLYAISGTDALALESRLHKHCAAYHLRGEWFELLDNVTLALEILTDVAQQARAALQPLLVGPRYVPPGYKGLLGQRILALLRQHETLTVGQLRGLLHRESIKTTALKVQLHRLQRDGLITRVAYGVYQVRPQLEVDDTGLSA